jgi:hypothetical protein
MVTLFAKVFKSNEMAKRLSCIALHQHRARHQHRAKRLEGEAAAKRKPAISRANRLPALAAELVHRQVAGIVTGGPIVEDRG